MLGGKNERMVREIAKLRKIVKNKYNKLKYGQMEKEREFETQFKPIIEPLTALASGENIVPTKLEPKVEQDSQFSPKRASTPVSDSDSHDTIGKHEEATFNTVGDGTHFLKDSFIGETSRYSPSTSRLSDALETSGGLHSASQYIESIYNNALTKKYMLKLMQDKAGIKRTIDHTFGPRFEGDQLMVGDKKLEFDEDGSIRIDNVSYRPTEGLYELLFKRIPDDEKFDEQDELNYKDILTRTSAHKKGYKRSSHINRDGSLKYKHVIVKLFPKQFYGRGGGYMLYKRLSDSDISYWDDPNEICDRLRLLTASAESGNNSHINEIINIIEELREAKYIKGVGNLKFRLLLK